MEDKDLMQYLTKLQIQRVDELAIKNGLEIAQMMELAGWHMVHVFNDLRIPKNKKILAVSGIGNNGGDALCSARHLYNNGWETVEILLARAKLRPDPYHQLELLRKMKLPTRIWSKTFQFKKYDIIIDGLIGYNINGNPLYPFNSIIEGINESNAKVIAYDLPSGLDATTGKAYTPCVFADATLTLHAPKVGLKTREGRKIAGRVFVGNIGIPERFYKGKI